MSRKEANVSESTFKALDGARDKLLLAAYAAIDVFNSPRFRIEDRIEAAKMNMYRTKVIEEIDKFKKQEKGFKRVVEKAIIDEIERMADSGISV